MIMFFFIIKQAWEPSIVWKLNFFFKSKSTWFHVVLSDTNLRQIGQGVREWSNIQTEITTLYKKIMVNVLLLTTYILWLRIIRFFLRSYHNKFPVINRSKINQTMIWLLDHWSHIQPSDNRSKLSIYNLKKQFNNNRIIIFFYTVKP